MVKCNALPIGPFRLLLLLAVPMCTMCSPEGQRTVDTSAVELDLRIGRLDQDLFHAPPDGIQAMSLKAYATYGDFYRTYIEDILQGAPLSDPNLAVVLGRFANDPDWRLAQHAVDSVLEDLDPQRLDLENAFKRQMVYFPDSLVPEVIAFNSGYNYGIYPTDSVLGIGAEWFIGADHPVVGMLAPDAFPQYMKVRMRPDMLVPSALKGWLLVHYTKDIRGADLLTNLVETGKILFLLDALLPDTEPALKFAFTDEQLAWCRSNEFAIWKDVVAKEQLFSKNADAIGRIMNDGPFTNGLPRESPGHIGEWIGYRMVSAYMDAHSDVSMADLFAMDDPNAILKSYKPR